MIKQIKIHNIKNIFWLPAMLLLFIILAIPAFIWWLGNLLYVLFNGVNIPKKNDFVS